jgi:Rps23 Pro-64 3,4-dihydroxylase Tpa1-like proline 4-hydroxylase
VINEFDYIKLQKEWREAQPFRHVVIDNFFDEETALKLAADFPNVSTDKGVFYNNALEVKKAIGDWNQFPKTTYSVFQYMCSEEFLQKIRQITGIYNLVSDYGLHGGGYHMHPRGGKLNMHKDYSIHPKLGLERRVNIIMYMTPDWQESWGGGLELWTHDQEKNLPKELSRQVYNKFNRAVIFDTTQNSWHGLPHPIDCPEDKSRNSLAIYYLSEQQTGAEQHTKAYFAPTKEQENDPDVSELIKVRAGLK